MMKSVAYIAVLLFLTCGFASGQKKDSINYRNLEAYDFHLVWLKADNGILIDVREQFEYRRNRIKDAVNMPSESRLMALTDTLDKKTPLLVYCSTDYRSKRAAEILLEKGFTDVINLDGGIVAWKKDGFPVDRKRLKASSK